MQGIAFQYAGILPLSMVPINGVSDQIFFAQNLFLLADHCCLPGALWADEHWSMHDSWLKNKDRFG